MEGQQPEQEHLADIILFPMDRVYAGREHVHEIGGRVINLALLSSEELKLLVEQCELRRQEAVLEAAIVKDYDAWTTELAMMESLRHFDLEDDGDDAS